MAKINFTPLEENTTKINFTPIETSKKDPSYQWSSGQTQDNKLSEGLPTNLSREAMPVENYIQQIHKEDAARKQYLQQDDVFSNEGDENTILNNAKSAFTKSKLVNEGIFSYNHPINQIKEEVLGINIPTIGKDFTFDNSPLIAVKANEYLQEAENIFSRPKEYESNDIKKTQSDVISGLDNRIAELNKIQKEADRVAKTDIGTPYQTTGKIEAAKSLNQESLDKIAFLNRQKTDLEKGFQIALNKNAYKENNFNNPEVVKNWQSKDTEDIVNDVVNKQILVESRDWNDYVDKQGRANMIDVNKMTKNQHEYDILPEEIKADPLTAEVLTDKNDRYKMSKTVRNQLALNGIINSMTILAKSADEKDSPENKIKEFDIYLKELEQNYKDNPTKETVKEYNDAVGQRNQYFQENILPKAQLLEKLSDIAKTRFPDLTQARYTQKKVDELNSHFLGNVYYGVPVTVADVMYNEILQNGKALVERGGNRLATALDQQTEEQETTKNSYLKERVEEDKFITPSEWKTSQFVEWDKDGFKVNPSLFLHGLTKTGVESLILGEVGAIGGKFLSPLLGKVLNPLIVDAGIVGLKYGEGAAEFAGMAAGTAAMFGHDLISAEENKGLSTKDAFNIGTIRTLIEAGTEKLFFDEVLMVKGQPISATMIADLKGMTKEELFKNTSKTFESLFGKKLSNNGFELLYNTKQFLKEAPKVAIAEAGEEVSGDLGNYLLDKEIKNKYKTYQSDSQFNLKSEFLTAINTMATMLPQGITSGIQQYNNSVRTARYVMSETPSLYIENVKNLLDKGIITKDQATRQLQVINEIAKTSLLTKGVNKQIDKSNLEPVDKERKKIEVFNNQLEISDIQKKLSTKLSDTEREKYMNFLEQKVKDNTDIQQEVNENLNLTPEQLETKRINNVKNAVNNTFSEVNLLRLNTEEEILKLKQATEANLALENDQTLKKVYQESLDKLNIRLKEIKSPKIEFTEVGNKLETEKQRVYTLSLEELTKERENLFSREDITDDEKETLAEEISKKQEILQQKENEIPFQESTFAIGDKVSTDNNKSFWFIKGKNKDTGDVFLERKINGNTETTTISNQPSNKDILKPYVEIKKEIKEEPQDNQPVTQEDLEGKFEDVSSIFGEKPKEVVGQNVQVDVQDKKADIEKRKQDALANITTVEEAGLIPEKGKEGLYHADIDAGLETEQSITGNSKKEVEDKIKIYYNNLEQPKEETTQVTSEKIEETKQEIVKETKKEDKEQKEKWENSAKRQNYFGTSINPTLQWENTLSVLKEKAKKAGKTLAELGYYITVIPESEFGYENKTQKDKDFEDKVKRGEAFLDKEKTKPYLQSDLDQARYAVITDKEGNIKKFDENGNLLETGNTSYSYLPKVSVTEKKGVYKLNLDSKFNNQKNLHKLYKLSEQTKKFTFEIESISEGFPKTTESKPTPVESTITGTQKPSIVINGKEHPIKLATIPSELADALLLLNQPTLSEEQLSQLPESLRDYASRFRYIQEVFYNKLGGKISLNKDGSYTSNGEIISAEQAKQLLTNSPINYAPSILNIPFDYITLKDNKFEVKNYPAGKGFIAENSTYTPTEEVVNQYISFGERVKDVTKSTKTETTPKEEVKLNVVTENPTENKLQPKKRTIKPFNLGEKSSDDLLKRKKSLVQNTTEKQNQEALDWFTNSPISKHVNFRDFRNLVNSDAWATWSQSAITLFKGANFTDLYHEAWHEFSQLYLTKSQRETLYKEVGAKTNFENEETIAEDFRKYVLSGQTLILGNKPKRNTLFRKIYNFLKELITGNVDLQTYYERLYSGNINQYKKNVDNAEFGKLNKAITGVIDEQERTLSEGETKDLTSAIDRAIATAFQERAIPFTALFTKKGVLNNTYNLLYKEFSNQANLAQEYYNQKLEEFGKTPTDSKLAEVNEASKTADNLYFTVANWEEITKHHKDNSKYLQIAKEAVDDTQEDEDNIKQFDAYDSDNTTSSKEQASKRVLYTIASLPKFVGKDIVANPFIPIQFAKEEEIETFANPDVVDFDKTWNLLSKTLQNTYNYNQIYAKIKELGNKKPEFSYLLYSLPDAEKQLTAEEMNIKHQFIQDLSKPLNKFFKVIFSTDKEGNLIVNTYKSGASATKLINENFTANFQTSEPTDFIKPNANSVNTLDTQAIIDEFKPYIKSSKNFRLSFLQALGFNFDEKTIASEEFQTLLKGNTDKDPISRIFNSIEEYNKNKFDSTIPITSPIKQLSYGIKDGSKSVSSGVKEDIEKLLSLEVEYNDDYYSDSIQNAAGDPIWQIEKWSLQTFLYNHLSDADTYPDYDALIKSPVGFVFNTATNPDMNNIFINSLFDLKTGKRRLDKDGNPITIEIINQDGLEIQPENQEREGGKTTNLTPNDKFIQDFNSLLASGVKEHLRYGDKNSAKGTLFNNFFDSTGRNVGFLPVPISSFNQDSLPTEAKTHLRRILISELTRTKALFNQDLGSNWKNFNKNAKSLGLFDGILKGELSKNIIKDVETLTPEEVVNKYSKQINDAINEYFSKESNKNKKLIDKIPVDIDKKISKNLLDRNTESTLLKAYSFNNWLLNADHVRLQFSDIRFYKNSKDAPKRYSKASSNGLIAINDDQTNEALNRLFPNLQYQKAGYIDTETTSVNTVIFNEDVRKSKFYDIYEEKWKDLRGFNKKGITEEEKEKVSKEVKDLLFPLTEMKIGDGQGWGTLDFIRRLKLKQGSDHWTSEHENLYTKIVNNEALPEDLGRAAMIFPVKIRVAGFTQDKSGYAVPIDYKFAVVPLFPQIIKNTPFEEIHNNMLKQGVGIGLFESGSKHSAIMNSPTEFNKFYIDDTKNTPYTGNYTINPINYDFIFDVLNVEPKLKDEVTFSTQLRRLLFSNFFTDGKPKNKDLYNKFNKAIQGLVDLEKENILKKVSAKWNETTKQYDINEKKFGAFLEDELDKRNLPDDAKQILKVNESGKFQYPLDSSKIRQTLESIAISIVDNKLRKQKGFGEALIQQSSSGFEQNGWKFEGVEVADVLKYGTNGFPFYSPNDKVTTAAKIGVSIATGDFKKLLKLNGLDGKLIETLDRLNEAIKDDNWLNTGDNRALISLTAVRIPVQGHNSMEFMEVYHFLPESAGNVIIVSPELVAKSGGDFDVDKLTTLFNHISVDENDVPVFVKELSDKEIIKKYNALKEEFLRQKLSLSTPLIAKAFGFTEKQFDSLIAEDVFNENELPSEQQFIRYWKKSALQNSLNQTIREVLESSENFRQLMLPNSTDIFEPSSDKLKEAKLGKQTNYWSDIATGQENYQQFASNLGGKKSLGIGAVYNTFFSSLQSVGAYLNNTYVDGFGKEKDVTIKLEHNSTKDGNVSVSRVFDKSGKHLISESISQLMNGWVDIAKKDWVFYMNGIQEVAPTQLYMLMTGVSPETMQAFTNQPIIDDYLETLQANKSLIVKLSNSTQYKEAKLEALTSAFEKYLPWDSNGEFIIEELTKKGVKKNVYKKSEIRGTTDIEGSSVKNIYLLRSKLQKFNPGNSDIFKLDNLKPTSLRQKSFDGLEQVQILTHFLQLQDQGQALSSVNKTINADRAKPAFLHASNLRYNAKATLEQSDILPKSTLDKLYEETTTSAFNSQVNGIDKFNQQLYGGKQLFELTNNPIFNSFISTQWNNDKDLRFSDKFKNQEEWFKTIKNDFLYFIYQNYVSNPLTNKLIVDEVMDLMAKSKTLNGVNQSLGDQLLQLKKQFPELTKTNSLLDLLTIDNSKKRNITSIKLKKDNVDADLSNQLKQDWDKLLIFSDYSAQENLLIQNFAKNLLNFDVIQSGLSNSKFSLMNFHPQNDFATQITPILNEYTDFVDKNEEVKEEFAKFYDRFKSNNSKFYTISSDIEETGDIVKFIGDNLSINQETYRFKDYRTNVTDKLSNKKQLNELKELSNKQDKVVVQEFTKDSPKEHKDWLYIGESAKGSVGIGGSGVINIDKPTNVFLLPLREKASTKPDSYLSDTNFENNKIVIDQSIAKIQELSKNYKKIVFPIEGFATEVSKLQEKAPKTLQYLNEKLSKNFFYNPKIELKQDKKIISNIDVERFNKYIEKAGKKPIEFFTENTKFSEFYDNSVGLRRQAPNNSKWVILPNGYYNLIDVDSGEVFIDNVDLQTGYKYINLNQLVIEQENTILQPQEEIPTEQEIIEQPIQNKEVKGENITSKGSEFAKKLTNVGNSVGLTYKGKEYVNSEHAYQTWKSGEFNQAGYNLKGGKVRGGKIGDTFSIMTDILTEKLKQHLDLVQGINERGGLEYLQKSTHNVIGDKFWESTGQNKFIEALIQAYKNVNQPTEIKSKIDSSVSKFINPRELKEGNTYQLTNGNTAKFVGYRFAETDSYQKSKLEIAVFEINGKNEFRAVNAGKNYNIDVWNKSNVSITNSDRKLYNLTTNHSDLTINFKTQEQPIVEETKKDQNKPEGLPSIDRTNLNCK